VIELLVAAQVQHAVRSIRVPTTVAKTATLGETAGGERDGKQMTKAPAWAMFKRICGCMLLLLASYVFAMSDARASSPVFDSGQVRTVAVDTPSATQNGHYTNSNKHDISQGKS